MSDTLFEIPEQLSPRLAWMREHKIDTMDKAYDPFTGDHRWMAFKVSNIRTKDFGDTENEALSALAVKMNLKLWNKS